MNIKPLTPVEVHWIDSATGPKTWTNISELEKAGEASIEVRTTGYFLCETKRTVRIIQSIQNQNGGQKYASCMVQIVKPAITSIKKLK